MQTTRQPTAIAEAINGYDPVLSYNKLIWGRVPGFDIELDHNRVSRKVLLHTFSRRYLSRYFIQRGISYAFFPTPRMFPPENVQCYVNIRVRRVVYVYRLKFFNRIH